MHTPCSTSSYNNLQLHKEAVKENEEEEVHCSAAVLQCLMDTSNSTISCASWSAASAASLTILAFMFLCSSLLCFLMPFSYAFDTFAHILHVAACSEHVASSVWACKWVGLLQSCDKQIIC